MWWLSGAGCCPRQTQARQPVVDKQSKASLCLTSCPDLSGALKDSKARCGRSSGVFPELTLGVSPVGASLGLLQWSTLWSNNSP